MSGNIFLSYRRGDEPGFVGRLYDTLSGFYAEDRLFLDVDNIEPGLDFVRILEEEISRCEVILAIIGNGWLESRAEDGSRRIDNPEDFVRIELASALALNKRVIPVLVNNACMPGLHDLPEVLRPLARRNAVKLSHERFKADAKGLIEALERGFARERSEVAETTLAVRPVSTVALGEKTETPEGQLLAPAPESATAAAAEPVARSGSVSFSPNATTESATSAMPVGGEQAPTGRSGAALWALGLGLMAVTVLAIRACGPALKDSTVPPADSEAAVQPEDDATANEEVRRFTSSVLAETEDVWRDIFQAEKLEYRLPTLTLFAGEVQTCGFTPPASGPFYCPGEQTIYVDTVFFGQLESRFGVTGKLAQAYVTAHEVGHHVQNLTGVLPKFEELRKQISEADANRLAARIELQADCFAGIWARFTAKRPLFQVSSSDRALNAAQQIGDDTLQKKMQGYVVPESFNHGTSAQRQTWFANGFRNGRLSDCDTFNNDV